MIVFHSLDEVHIDGDTAVTVGKFDGFHIGHRTLLNAVSSERFSGLRSLVLSLDFSPFTEEPQKKILTEEETLMLLSSKGVDYLFILPLTKDLSNMSPEDFVSEILIGRLHAKVIFSGEDFTFGSMARGNTELLSRLSPKYGFRSVVLPNVFAEGMEVKSSRIRSFLSKGKIGDANAFLGRDYEISGEVVHGRGIARTFGFPTLNIIPDEEKLLPRFGVYAAIIEIDGNLYEGMANIGVKPTLTDGESTLLEAHLFDTDGDFYGKTARVSFKAFVRPERKFESTDALKTAILGDVREVREIFS